MKHTLIQILKFSIVGFLAFLIDSRIYTFLTGRFGMEYHLLFSVISFSVSVVFNYICSMKFVFEGKENMSRSTELFLFIALSLVGLGINSVMMWLVVDIFKIQNAVSYVFGDRFSENFLLDLSGMGAKAIATVVVMVWNFISRKMFLEKKREA